jgi:hypothetical protein
MIQAYGGDFGECAKIYFARNFFEIIDEYK